MCGRVLVALACLAFAGCSVRGNVLQPERTPEDICMRAAAADLTCRILPDGTVVVGEVPPEPDAEEAGEAPEVEP